MSRINDPIDVATRAAADYQRCYGEGLVSVVVYGSAAGGDFDPVRSDVNLLVVIADATLPMLEKSAEVQKKWLKHRCTTPIFMDRAYIKQSLDSFPIEFLDMKGRRKVVMGEDVLADLQIDLRDLRLQVERELKGKRLRLMQQWLRVRGSPRLRRQLLDISLRDFAPVFRALLHLKNQSIPRSRGSVYAAVDEVYGLDGAPFRQAWEALQSSQSARIAAIFPAYSAALRTLAGIVDSHQQ
jgi:predicted nucleotidyltransferase